MALFRSGRARPAPQPDETSPDLTSGPVWLDRLVHGDREPANSQPAGRTLHVHRPNGPWGVGLRDSVASGWFDADSGQIVPGVPITPDDVVVDFGCGEGNLLGFCADRGATVIGIDNHQETLDAAGRRLEAAGATAEFLLYPDEGPLPLPDGTATVVLCTEVLEHVPRPATVMAELVRIAAPGARFVITVPSAESEELTRRQNPPGYFESPNHINVFSQYDFVKLVEQAGLTVDSVSRLGFFWSVWFALHWHTGVGTTGSHPVLDLWTATWDQLLDSPGGEAAKAALDATLPKYQMIVARAAQDNG